MRRLLPDPGRDDLDDRSLAEAYRGPPGPWLRANFITSLDGAVTVEGRSGGLGSPGDRRVFRVLRALADVVLVGAGTAAAEGYRAMAADSPVGRLRTALGRPPVAPIAVVSRRASLDPGDRLVTAAVLPVVLITCAAADAGRRAALAAAGTTVLVCGEEDVDLPLALDRLAELGHRQVLCEGGPALLSAALRAGAVNELDLTLAPALVGGADRLLAGPALAHPVRPRLLQVIEEDGVLFTRYVLRPPGSRPTSPPNGTPRPDG